VVIKLDLPFLTAIAFMISLDDTGIGLEYKVDDVVGADPSVV